MRTQFSNLFFGTTLCSSFYIAGVVSLSIARDIPITAVTQPCSLLLINTPELVVVLPGLERNDTEAYPDFLSKTKPGKIDFVYSKKESRSWPSTMHVDWDCKLILAEAQAAT